MIKLIFITFIIFFIKMNNYKIYLFILKLKNYEPEIVSTIYDMTKKPIKINKSYIIEKNINKEIRRQIVRIDDYEVILNKYCFKDKLYSYYYGVVGFHEGFCTYEQIKELDDVQNEANKKGLYWKLPQEFYQSMPS
mgnify:FL=1